MIQTASPPLGLYRIGEVMRLSGLSRQTVHNYTVLGLITERERTPGGHRLYGEETFQRLARVVELRKTMTLAEVGRALQMEFGGAPGEGQPPAPPGATEHGKRSEPVTG